MTLRGGDLRELDRLLDSALDLEPVQREAWLAALPADVAHLAPVLRDLIARHAGLATDELLGRPPIERLIDAPGDDAAGSMTAGATIGPYRLLRELGAGGMGVVWLGERVDRLIERPVALKLPLFSTHHRALAERFNRERAILARLAHPNIAVLYDAGVTATGQPYLALEYVEGEPLTKWCDARRLSLRERVALVAQVLRAVQYAHAKLVIHRDLKPSNILVTARGEVRLLDFGIAKLASPDEPADSDLTLLSGRALTPNYAAPELIAGKDVSIAADIYSMGVILYELVAGRRPFRAQESSNLVLFEAVLNAEPPAPSTVVTDEAARCRGLPSARRLAAELAGDLDTIILKALGKRPEERYATAASLLEDLERHLAGEAIEARAEHTAYRLARFIVKRRWALAAAAAVVIALVAGSGIALWQANEARREAALARSTQDFMLELFRTNSAEQRDPVRARQTTARQLLDRGAARIAQSLQGQPVARLQVLETLSRMYQEMGLWAEASELAKQRVALAQATYGRDDLRVADAMTNQLFFLSQRDDIAPETLEALIREALRIHRLHNDVGSLSSARLHARAAEVYLDQSPGAAVEHATQAVESYRERYPTDRGYAYALSTLGTALLRQGIHRDEALAMQEQALQVARALRVPEHVLLYFLRRAGDTCSLLGHYDKAEPYLREALSLSERVHGPKHVATLMVRRTLARNLAWMSRLDEAAELAQRTIADTMSAEGREPYLVRDTHRTLFTVHWERGDIAAARAGIESALATYGAESPETFEHADLLVEGAAVDATLGRYAEALAKLELARVIAGHIGLGKQALFFTEFALTDAMVRIGAGDPAGARSVLDERLRVIDNDNHLARTRALFHAGLVEAYVALRMPDAAYEAALQAQQELERDPGRDDFVGTRARIERALARALMARGAYSDALGHLHLAAAALGRVHVAGSPFRAEVEALRVICLAHLGQAQAASSALNRVRIEAAERYATRAAVIVALAEARASLAKRD